MDPADDPAAPPVMTEAQRSHPPPWIFALSYIPYGVVGSFAGPVLSNLSDRAGISTASRGWFVTLMLVPPMLQFLYTPIIDVGPRRKYWLVGLTVLSAACIVGAITRPLPEQIGPFLAFSVAASLISGLIGSCNGGLLATMMPDHLRGRAGAWVNIGNLSGGAAAAALIIFLAGRDYDPWFIGAVTAAMMILPALAILTVRESQRQTNHSLGELLSSTLRDVGDIVLSKRGASGLLLCLSPVGTAALANFWAGFGTPYHVSSDMMAFVTGPASVGLTAVGSLAGGYLCDRYNRRAMYLASGATTAICGILIALSPATEMTFVVGVTIYALITGFCYSAFTATVLETIGEGGKAASTQYALFTSTGNAAIAWVGLVDTRFDSPQVCPPCHAPDWFCKLIEPVVCSVPKVEGVVFADAALNLIGVVVIGLVFWKLKSFGKSRHPEPTAVEVPEARIVSPDR